jgi:hypothetical protein
VKPDVNQSFIMRKEIVMNKCFILLVAISFSGLLGCMPNLVVKDASMDFSANTVEVSVKNNGSRGARSHVTYIEINEVGTAANVKPQSQYIASISRGSVVVIHGTRDLFRSAASHLPRG